MPSLDKKLNQLKKSIEVRFLIIFRQISKTIKGEEKSIWHRSEIAELEDLFVEAAELVKRDRENRMYGNKHSYSDYFRMRKYQFELLKDVLVLIDKLPKKSEISTEVALFIDDLSQAVHTDDTAIFYLDELQALKEKFKQIELPKDYQDFEAKSILFQLLQEIERYLSAKRNLMQPEKKDKKPLSEDTDL